MKNSHIMKKRLIILAVTLLAMMAVQAQNIIRPKVECPNGIYVNSYNGVLFYQRPDVSVSNRNMRLEAVFYYNSSSNKKNYGYGNGWSLGGELRYIEDSLGIIIEQGDGRQDLFTRYGNSFEAPAGVFSTLSIEGNGYLLTYKDGTKYYFADAESKKVTLVKDRYDNTITYVYQEGNLATATDISGRSLNFTWADSLLVGLSTSFDNRTWSYQYDEKGNLTCVTDPMGYSVYYAYDKDNRIKTFTDAEGYSTYVSYNVDGMAHRVKTDLTDKSIRYEIAKRQTVFIDYLKDANNQYSKYIWDEAGRLAEIVNVNMGTSTKFAYDDDNNLIRREDANGHAYTYTYDQNGNCLSITDPLGNTEYYTYESAFNKVTSYTDKMGHSYNYQYDSHGDLLQMNGPLNYSLSMTYNQYGQPVTFTNANGNTSHYGYDGYGNFISITDPLGNVTTITYNQAGLPLTLTDPNGAVSTFVYDNAEYLIEAIDGLNFSTQMQYDRKGNMVGYTDALDHTFTFSYDAIGQLISAFSPEGAHIQFCYSGNRLTKFVDAMNHENCFVYGDNNQLVMSIDAINDTIRRAYDNVGDLVGVSLANGENIVYQYDALGRVISASDQMGTFYVCHYDANNNVIQIENALGYSDYFTYDALGRLIQHTDAMGNSEYLSYDNKGNLLTYMDRNGNATILSYDAKGNMVTHTNALNYMTSYSYNSNGNLVSVTDANGNTTTCEYDLLYQLKKVTFPNGKTRRFWYDGKGNITLQENEAGEQTTLTYDAVDRLTTIQSSDRTNEYSAFQYDLAGNLISASNQNATSIFTRDAVGRLLSEEMNGALTTYSYNTANRTVGITYPSGKQVMETRDLRSRTTGVYVNGGVVASFEYNNAGNVISRTYANSAVTNYAYDELGRMNHLYDNHNTIDYQLVYDASNNLLARKDMINVEDSQSYTYDALDRLVDYQRGEMNNDYLIAAPACHISYGLDGLGNRTDVIENGVTTHFSTNMMNAYTSIIGPGSNQNMVYDDNGNLTNDGIHTYQYDGNNRRVSVDNGNSVIYKYDALGRMIQRQVPSVSQTENYHYARNMMIEENDDYGNLVSSFVYGQNTKDIVKFIKGNNSYYLQKDQLGSTTLLIDDNNAISERYSYDPFGKTTVFSRDVSTEMPFLYEGNYMDDYTGSYHTSDRNYNTTQGRYTEQDVLVYVKSMNTYSYENNNPASTETKFDAFMGGISDGGSVLSALGPKSLSAAGDLIAEIQGGVEMIRLWDKSGVWPWSKKGFATFEEEYAADSKFVGTVLAAPICGTVGAFEGAIRGGLREAWNVTKDAFNGNSSGGLSSGLRILKGAWNQALNDAGYYAGLSQDVFEGMGREAGKARDQWVDIMEADCLAFVANGSDYENATRQQQKAYNIAQNKPTNEFYYMTGIPFSDAHAEKMMRRGARRKDFVNTVKSWFD